MYDLWEAIDSYVEQLDFDEMSEIIPQHLGDLATQFINITDPLLEEMEEHPNVDLYDWSFAHEIFNDNRKPRHPPFMLGCGWESIYELASYISKEYNKQP